ncbi:MAG: hypothetical protein BM556_08820 [Bacteriovorax sp. MedPE-SWde]|nr:MAG: hypothetical protein BM556_08820 [Bacteriovorax sp. MedPE-SWde]
MSVVDYTIYQQAIYDLSLFETWNPFNTIRNVFIFNEHFDPVIFLAAPFVRLLSYTPSSLLIFEWLWYLAFALFIFTKQRESIQKHPLFFVALILFSRSILGGLLYPAHPVTWAILPLAYLVYSLSKDSFKGVLIACISLCFFKETFPFGIFGLSFAFLLRKQYQRFLILFVISTFFIIFELKLRAILIGKTIGYGNQFLGNIISDPIIYGTKILKEFHYKDFFKVFFAYLIPVFLVARKEIKNLTQLRHHYFTSVLCFLLPLIAIHIIINRYSYHHASKFGAVMIATVAFSNIKNHLTNKKLKFLCILLLIIGGSSMYTKIFKNFVFNKITACSPSKEMRSTSQLVHNSISELPLNAKIYTTGGIGAKVLRPNMSLHHHRWSPLEDFYDVIILETSGVSNTWPLDRTKILSIKNKCKEFSDKIYINTEHIFMAKGKFPQSCIY